MDVTKYRFLKRLSINLPQRQETLALKLDNYKQSLKWQYFVHFLSTFQGVISEKMLWDFAIHIFEQLCTKSFAFNFSYAFFCLSFSFTYSCL